MLAAYKNQKIPDFASRLKAVYDVPGTKILSENVDNTPDNIITILRRALIIRHNLVIHAQNLNRNFDKRSA